MKTIKGTSIELILAWILAMEEDIKNNKFYCIRDEDRLGVNPLNRARLSIMYSILHITDMDYSESQWSGFSIYAKKNSIQIHHNEMKEYFKTIKSLINIT